MPFSLGCRELGGEVASPPSTSLCELIMEETYIRSHTAPGKGRAYDESYRTNPWSRYLWSREQAVLGKILQKHFPSGNADLLDFACGTGRITSFLEDKVRTSTGIDVSQSMLQQASHKLKKTELLEANLLQANPFGARKFNLITAFRFFVNAEPELRLSAMKALAGLLADDGIFVFNNHQNSDAPYIRLALWNMARKKLTGYNTLSLEQCHHLAASAGLRITEVYPVGLLHLPKCHLPPILYKTVDATAMKLPFVAGLSESPILLARKIELKR
jgi:SAM-dependent methyltransferase